MQSQDVKKSNKIVTQDPESDAELDRIHAEFDRVMNTSSPNPRYGGRTPMELVKVLLNTPKKKIKPAK